MAIALIGAGLLSACGVEPTPTPAPHVVGSSSDALVPFSVGDDEYVRYTSRDTIVPVYEPTFVAASAASLAPDDIVLGFAVNGDAHPYPEGLLIARGIINDTVGGTPVLVSW
jgi:hypothetical protein